MFDCMLMLMMLTAEVLHISSLFIFAQLVNLQNLSGTSHLHGLSDKANHATCLLHQGYLFLLPFLFFAVPSSNYSSFVAILVVVCFTQLTLGTSHCRGLTKSLGKC